VCICVCVCVCVCMCVCVCVGGGQRGVGGVACVMNGWWNDVCEIFIFLFSL